MTAADWALLLLLGVLWGGSFFFIEVALSGLTPLTLVLARVGLGALVLVSVLRVVGRALPRGWRVWRALLGMAVMNNLIPFTLFAFGQTQIGGGLAAILNATTPLWAVLIAHAALPDERATAMKGVGVLAGFAGVAVMLGATAAAGLSASLLAQLACLGAALSYAVAGVYGRRFRAMGLPPLATAAGQLLCSALLLAPVALAVETPWRLSAPGWEVVGAVAALVLLSTALAYVIYFRILSTAGATNILLVTFLNPVTAILLGVAVLGERLEPRHLGGMALIALGLAMIDGRLPRAVMRALRPPRAVRPPRPEPAACQRRDT